MADIRVERKSGGRVWLWILLVLVLLIVAAFLLDRAGYVDLPINISSSELTIPASLAHVSTGVHLQEA